MLDFNNTFNNDHFKKNAVLTNPCLLTRFSTCNAMRLERALRNGTVTGLLAKKQPNQFIEF